MKSDQHTDHLVAQAQRIERHLLSEGWELMEVTAILASAFVSSLANLSKQQRQTVLDAHISGIDLTREILMSMREPTEDELKHFQTFGQARKNWR